MRAVFVLVCELSLKPYLPYVVYGLLKELPTAIFCHVLSSYLFNCLKQYDGTGKLAQSTVVRAANHESLVQLYNWQ